MVTDSGQRTMDYPYKEGSRFSISVANILQSSQSRHFPIVWCVVYIHFAACRGFCRIFATELEDRRPKTVPYLEEVVE